VARTDYKDALAIYEPTREQFRNAPATWRRRPMVRAGERLRLPGVISATTRLATLSTGRGGYFQLSPEQCQQRDRAAGLGPQRGFYLQLAADDAPNSPHYVSATNPIDVIDSHTV